MRELLSERLGQLKTEIRMQLESTLLRFVEQTGICPSAIRVHMIETTTAGDHTRKYVPGEVEVEFRV